MNKHQAAPQGYWPRRLEIAALCLAALVAFLSFERDGGSGFPQPARMAGQAPAGSADDIEATRQEMVLHD